MTLAGELKAICELALAGEPEQGLERLVACWRRSKQPELAELAERWAGQLAAAEPPAIGGTGSARAAWLETGARKRTASLPRLFDSLPDTTGPYAAERVESLLEWEPNPVIAARVTAWLLDCPFIRKARGQCMPPAVELLARQADPRCVSALERCLAERSRTVNALGMPTWKPLQALLKKSGSWPVQKALTEDERAALATLAQRVGQGDAPSNLEPLWQRVREAPKDEAARWVLADALQERKDPRGEFIALQLARARDGAKPTARERELQKLWRADWLGPVHGVLVSDVEFERGFPVSGRFVNTGVPEAGSQWPQWATFERLDATNASVQMKPVSAAIASPHARSLVQLDGLGERDFEALLRAEHRHTLQTVRLNVYRSRESVELFVKGTGMPALTRFGIDGHINEVVDRAFILRLLNAPLGAQLKALELRVTPKDFGVLLTTSVESKLEEVVATSEELRLRYTVATRQLHVEVDHERGRTLGALQTALASVPRALLAGTSLELGRNVRSREGFEAAIRLRADK